MLHARVLTVLFPERSVRALEYSPFVMRFLKLISPNIFFSQHSPTSAE